jgi:hypothetical protein
MGSIYFVVNKKEGWQKNKVCDLRSLGELVSSVDDWILLM